MTLFGDNHTFRSKKSPLIGRSPPGESGPTALEQRLSTEAVYGGAVTHVSVGSTSSPAPVYGQRTDQNTRKYDYQVRPFFRLVVCVCFWWSLCEVTGGGAGRSAPCPRQKKAKHGGKGYSTPYAVEINTLRACFGMYQDPSACYLCFLNT